MADINQVISLGIGTPADIEHFVLFGLNVSLSPAVELDLLTAVGADLALLTAGTGLALTTVKAPGALALSTAGVGHALTTVKGAGGLALTTERQNT